MLRGGTDSSSGGPFGKVSITEDGAVDLYSGRKIKHCDLAETEYEPGENATIKERIEWMEKHR